MANKTSNDEPKSPRDEEAEVHDAEETSSEPTAAAPPDPEPARASEKEEPAQGEDAADTSAVPRAPDPVIDGNPLVGLAWAFGLLFIGLVILAVLARLPPVQ